ncbi:MAG TPA: PadR family transcriptional regulator [Streptosporangiaceae bacterium]
MPRNRALSPQATRVLRALAAGPARWRYGYELGTETGLQAGSLYPILVRLAGRGLLEAKWEESPPQGRPARHLYRITAPGLELAAIAPVAPLPAAAGRSARTSAAARRAVPAEEGASARRPRTRRTDALPDGA